MKIFFPRECETGKATMSDLFKEDLSLQNLESSSHVDRRRSRQAVLGIAPTIRVDRSSRRGAR
jgi:hypothetical protein